MAQVLAAHPLVSDVHDRSASKETPDFVLTLDGQTVRLELKEKGTRCDPEIAGVWPEVAEPNLLIVDEKSLRSLIWADGIGYLAVADRPQHRWLLFGPWELWLAPRRRYERPHTRGQEANLKGKILLDARSAAATTTAFDVDALVDVVRRSRRALHQLHAVDIAGVGPLPTVPRINRDVTAPSRRARRPTPAAPTGQPEADASDWCGLSERLVAEVRRRWSWDGPTSVQRAAIPAILDRRTTLVLGPTAGGKTEAALLPLLDRWYLEGWGSARPSILCLSPLKALLDDQLERWRRASALVGASAFAWHGDVHGDDKRAFRADPADALLTTPESLELLLSNADDRRRLAGVRAVVIDEAHAFIGQPRGAQVASLLERLETIAHEDVQRVALSATVADRSPVVAWLRGRSLLEATAVDGGKTMVGEVVTIRSHESLDEAAEVINRERKDRRCLIFGGSRKRVEELADRLGAVAHHSSVSGQRRRDALDDLRTGVTDVLVTSSGLEMGIDVGDLDLVIHDGPPPSPSSYLQRLGRAGRRTGHRAITFLTSSPDDLLLTLAVLVRARRDDLDPIDPRRGARLVLGHQALLLTLQQAITGRRELYETLRFSPAFAGLEEEMDATIAYLIERGILAARGDVIALGGEGQRRYGRRIHELLAMFTSTVGAAVVDEEGRPVGELDWSLVSSADAPVRRHGLVLGGTRWRVIRVNEGSRTVIVAPGGTGAARGWRGTSLAVSRRTWAAAREVLTSTDVPSDIDERAQGWLSQLRQAWAPRLGQPVVADAEGMTAHTFAGDDVHQAVLRVLAVEGRAEGPTLLLLAAPEAVAERAARARHDMDAVVEAEALRRAETMPVAHRELCAPSVLHAEAREFEVDSVGIEAVLTLLSTWPS